MGIGSILVRISKPDENNSAYPSWGHMQVLNIGGHIPLAVLST